MAGEGWDRVLVGLDNAAHRTRIGRNSEFVWKGGGKVQENEKNIDRAGELCEPIS